MESDEVLLITHGTPTKKRDTTSPHWLVVIAGITAMLSLMVFITHFLLQQPNVPISFSPRRQLLQQIPMLEDSPRSHFPRWELVSNLSTAGGPSALHDPGHPLPELRASLLRALDSALHQEARLETALEVQCRTLQPIAVLSNKRSTF
eukprot:TRINITY_DN33188_c0_g1_i2.p2 TRINITY_DN33188_c0_g1~~TRINITY_DN33188_c0_g1_i2.p2  ORF type:complete len:148 (-),score=14.39 TRINITY_DN33188_c0_g1_i2:1601-2044(-)